jgi:hypothetical protein
VTHDLGIVKLVEDNNIMVISHKSQKDALVHTHEEDQIHLGHSRDKGDSVSIQESKETDYLVDQYLWDGGGDEADIQE